MRSFTRFLFQLKKRHVYRVAVAYAVVAWAVVEVSATVVPELELPAWITPTILIIALLGFPLALVLAWAYDLGPAGVQRKGSSESPQLEGRAGVNGRVDEEHPWLTRALPLWNLQSEPKELALFDGVGHLPPVELRIPAIRDFLDRHLR